MMQTNLLILLVFVCATASAQVFKRVGPDGKVYFSDQPGPDSTQIEVAPAQAVSLPPVNEQTGTTEEQGTPGPAYTAFSIVSPASDQSIRANNGNVIVQLSLEPELKPGHTIKLIIDGEDGESIKPGGGMSTMLSNLSRGLHTVAAAVLDEAGEAVIRTEAVSFHVLRATRGGG